MIRRSPDFDLGRDTTRIKDPQDAHRQAATVDELLLRFFGPESRRAEVQMVADEVGMGKTFVALGAAYSILAPLVRAEPTSADLERCYRRVLIVTPDSDALFQKWNREVGAFLTRCASPEAAREATPWWHSVPVRRLDELARQLRSARGGRVLVAKVGMFGARIENLGLKQRQLLALLFTHWSNRLPLASRERILAAAPRAWPREPRHLGCFDEAERARLVLSDASLARGIRRAARRGSSKAAKLLEVLLEKAKEIATPFVRNRSQLVEAEILPRLKTLYRLLAGRMIAKAFPLVVVDEAHQWRTGRKGRPNFLKLLGGKVRRLLLLTATPFQLRPSEMLEIMKVTEVLAPSPEPGASRVRQAALESLRSEVIEPALSNSTFASQQFQVAWSRLPRAVRTTDLDAAWCTPEADQTRHALRALAQEPGVVDPERLDAIIDASVAAFDPNLRGLLRAAWRLFVYNADLSAELGRLVIRHRRRTDHRLFRVGEEISGPQDTIAERPDRSVMHVAPGLTFEGDGELVQFLLMRATTEMKQGKGRSSLGENLTGCYSTLLQSADGKTLAKDLAEGGRAAEYFGLVQAMVGEDEDPKHPKMKSVVDQVVQAWELGEKSLIFCFRSHTAERIRHIVRTQIDASLARTRRRRLGGENALESLRKRMTARDQDLISVALDRVLWSLHLATGDPPGLQEFVLLDEELSELARIALERDLDLLGDRVDRVFLNRATEHLLARRPQAQGPRAEGCDRILESMADVSWIDAVYGRSPESEEDSAEGGHFDERGVHSAYPAVRTPSPGEVHDLAAELAARRDRARSRGQVPVLDTYALGPSLWTGPDEHPSPAVTEFHRLLRQLTIRDGTQDWETRRQTMASLRRAVLREAVLVRLLPTKSERGEAQWGELLVEFLHHPVAKLAESFFQRLVVYLEDLAAADAGPGATSERAALLAATRLGDAQTVALVRGDTALATRDRLFVGFNTPLLPEVLVCTSVGQEGIDLHRHCRRVFHYDLAWNPATIEQRTGRTDRIGSKTFRERDLSPEGEQVFLEVSLPYLAATYDERQYEELRKRAQLFEVLTGGDMAADQEELDDPGEGLGLQAISLPPSMIQDLRVELGVWNPIHL